MTKETHRQSPLQTIVARASRDPGHINSNSFKVAAASPPLQFPTCLTHRRFRNRQRAVARAFAADRTARVPPLFFLLPPQTRSARMRGHRGRVDLLGAADDIEPVQVGSWLCSRRSRVYPTSAGHFGRTRRKPSSTGRVGACGCRAANTDAN